MRILFKNLLTTLRRYPTAVLLNVAGLMVAFTAFVVILMQVRYEYAFNSHIPEAGQVFRVEQGYNGDRYQTMLDQNLIEQLTASSAHIRSASLWSPNWYLRGDFRVERSNGKQDYFHAEVVWATPPVVDILGMEFIEGDSTVLQRDTEVLLPLSMARRMFPDESAVGKKLFMSDGAKDLTVGGVYRDFPQPTMFPNVILMGHPWMDRRGNCNYLYFVRLDDPAAVQDVTEAMTSVVRKFYDDDTSEQGSDMRLVGVRDLYFDGADIHETLSPRGNRTTTDILLAIAVLVVVIASINFVNFASALTPVRMKMINLQKIMGAGIWQLRLSLLFEAVMISLMAYLLSLCLVASLGGTPFAQYILADMSLGANLPLVGWCTLIAVGVGFVAGLYPAFYMTSFRPILAVKGTFGTSATGRAYRMTLVGLQYVISLALIIATLFINLQNRYVTHLEMGYDKDQIVVVKLPDDAAQKQEALTAQLRNIAAVEGVAYADQRFGGEEWNYNGWGRSFKDFEDGISYRVVTVSDDFLRVLGIPVLEGRDFRPSDVPRESGSYIFNAPARERYRMELGDYVSQDDVDSRGNHFIGWGEIVGFLSDDVHIFSQRMAAEPFGFYMKGAMPGSAPSEFAYVRIAAGSDLLAAADHVRRSVRSVTPYDFDVQFMDSVVNSVYARELKAGVLVTLFSVLAILISLMGVFGLVLFETQYRRQEIGIRKVNGATSASILLMFNRRFMLIVVVSFLIAAPVAWYGVKEWLLSFQSAVPLYAWVFAAAFALVLAITVLTVTVRSWRTANANPVESIKN